MTNRLPYSTTAGSISSDDTFKQLIENLTLAQEDLLALSSMAKARSDKLKATQWLTIAESFIKITAVVIRLSRGANPSSTGYTGHGQ